MKNLQIISLSIILLICFSLSIKAQPAKSTWLTTSAGLSSTWIINQNAYGNPELDYGTKFGLLANIGLSHFIDNEYGFSTGLGFGNLGQSYQGEQKGATATRKVSFNYIQVPILGMKQLCDPRHPCWLTFGPQLMFLTSASQKYSREDGEALPNPQYLMEGKKDVSDWYKPFDIMLNLGFTNIYSMRTADNFRMMVSYQAALGLLDINASAYQIPNANDIYKSSHNFYLGVQVGLMFNP